MKCRFKSCSNQAFAKSLCGAHYQQQRQGKELTPLQKQYHGLTELERFHRRVNKLPSGCWEWTGSLNTGYGQFRLGNGNIILAHRYAYAQETKQNIDNFYVCHSCDNPKCVNPSHLFLGDQQANMDDMWNKGRGKPGTPKGERHGMSKLNAEQVKAIRASTLPTAEIAREYSISRAVVYDVVKRRTWKHVI
jgi:hypothetical protein